MKKERVEEIVNNEGIELLYPEDPDQYYVYKIKPIWAKKSDLDTPVSNLSINDPKKMKKYDIDEFNYMEFIPEPKNIQQENNDKIEILHPEEPIKYYKSKMVHNITRGIVHEQAKKRCFKHIISSFSY